MEALCIAKAGLLAGIVMALVAMALKALKFTKLDLTQYVGCILTGKASGMANMLAGVGVHVVMSIVFAFVYVWIAAHFNMAMSIMTGATIGAVHTLIGGLFFPFMDRLNSCVKSGKLKPMKMFAQGYDISGTATYALVHVVYGVALFHILMM